MKKLSLALVLASVTAVSAHAGLGLNDIKIPLIKP